MDYKTIYEFVVVINILLILYFLLVEKKNYRSLLLWVVLFVVFPIGGYLIYLILGRGLLLPFYYVKSNESNLTMNNKIKYFTHGANLFSDVIDEIKNAKSSVHIESYIFRDDNFSKDLLILLERKQKEGVNVRIVYDPNGNLFNSKRQFRRLINAGGKVYKYYHGIFQILNFNYRNHRKIIVIDGKIGYLGGFNIGDEYLSHHHRITPWRDSQIKIRGESVYYLQKEFINDYLSASKHKEKNKTLDLFKTTVDNYCPISIASFFPNEEIHNIKEEYLKEIYRARKRIIIQTPYFIPDIGLLNALHYVLRNGIEVIVMIPKVYDKKISYYSTLEYSNELYNLGAKVYLYQGFIHAKTVMIDDTFLSIGSSNFDIRSFHHNIETNAFIYSKKEVENYFNIIQKDIQKSDAYSKEYALKELKKYRIGQKVFKLLSSLM